MIISHSSLRRFRQFLFVYAAGGLLAFLWALPSLTQQQAPQKHPPTTALVNVPRVVVPDVRGRQLKEAQESLREAGLKPGRTSTELGPGIVGTVLRQEPQQNSVVVYGTVFNLVLVAPTKVRAPSDGDEEFSTQVPKLVGLTPNQTSNLLNASEWDLEISLAVQGRVFPERYSPKDQRPELG